jgi:hypothetical protein
MLHSIFDLLITGFVLLCVLAFVIRFGKALAWLFGGLWAADILVQVVPRGVWAAALALLMYLVLPIFLIHRATHKRPGGLLSISLADRRAWGFSASSPIENATHKGIPQ